MTVFRHCVFRFFFYFCTQNVKKRLTNECVCIKICNFATTIPLKGMLRGRRSAEKLIIRRMNLDNSSICMVSEDKNKRSLLKLVYTTVYTTLGVSRSLTRNQGSREPTV